MADAVIVPGRDGVLELRFDHAHLRLERVERELHVRLVALELAQLGGALFRLGRVRPCLGSSRPAPPAASLILFPSRGSGSRSIFSSTNAASHTFPCRCGLRQSVSKS